MFGDFYSESQEAVKPLFGFDIPVNKIRIVQKDEEFPKETPGNTENYSLEKSNSELSSDNPAVLPNLAALKMQC